MASKRMTAKADHAMDRRMGIKEGSARDLRLDRKYGVRDAASKKGRKKGRA